MRRRWWQWTGGATKGVVSNGGRGVRMAPEPGEGGDFGVGDWINSTRICGKKMPPQTRHNRPEGASTPCGLPADTYGKRAILRSSINATPHLTSVFEW